MQGNLILIRNKNHITQTEVAKWLDVAPKTYRRKELDKAAFTSDEMFIISKKLKLPMDDIFLPREHQNGNN